MTNTKKKIKDNPSILHLKKDLEGAETTLKLIPFLSEFGINKDNVNLSKFHEIKNQFNLISNLPDRFNELFARDGWIAYETMNIKIMKIAVDFGENDEKEKADALLVEYYSEENLKWMLERLNGIEEFRPRYELIQKAFEDYKAGRYYACIPVILMMIDGVVNDIGEQKGFFAEGVDLNVWDSIAGHSSGLSELAKLFNKARKKTTDEKITVPYRNGILHGRDLGYANKTVAAKSWASLLAIRDWAGAIKEGKKNPEPEKRESTLLENINSIISSIEKHKEFGRKQEKLMQKMKKWMARKIEPNKDFPETGCANDYSTGSPEREAVIFIENWSKQNYGKMAELIMQYGGTHIKISKLAGQLRKIFEVKKLINFKITRIIDEAPAISEVEISFEIEKDGKNLDGTITLRLLYVNNKGELTLRGENGGTWKITENFPEIENI